jgi:hypothetical protein
MQRLPETRRAPLTPEQRAHLAGVAKIAADAQAARELRAAERQRNDAAAAERAIEMSTWAEGVVRGFARAEAEGRELARQSWPRGAGGEGA